MVQMGRQGSVATRSADAKGYDLERAIVDRVANVWILGRTVFDNRSAP